MYAFGLATGFQTQLFPGSRRLFELADQICCALQVEVLCWCGLPARFNARVNDGVVVREGAQVVVADTAPGTPAAAETQVRYQVLCRRHWRRATSGRFRTPSSRFPWSDGGRRPGYFTAWIEPFQRPIRGCTMERTTF